MGGAIIDANGNVDNSFNEMMLKANTARTQLGRKFGDRFDGNAIEGLTKADVVSLRTMPMVQQLGIGGFVQDVMLPTNGVSIGLALDGWKQLGWELGERTRGINSPNPTRQGEAERAIQLLNNAKLAPDVREALNAGIADGRLGKIDQGDGQAVSIKAAPAGGWKLK